MLAFQDFSNSAIEKHPVYPPAIFFEAGIQRPVEDPGFFTGHPVSANAGKGFRRNDLDEKRDFMQLEG